MPLRVYQMRSLGAEVVKLHGFPLKHNFSCITLPVVIVLACDAFVGVLAAV